MLVLGMFLWKINWPGTGLFTSDFRYNYYEDSNNVSLPEILASIFDMVIDDPITLPPPIPLRVIYNMTMIKNKADCHSVKINC